MATLSSVLAQIRQNESGGNYGAQNPSSSASGAYQFVNGTWQTLTQQSGIGTQYATAGSAPPGIQDAVAAYALQNNPNPNSCSLWGTCNAAGQVTGPARYPTVDTYDISPTQLAAGNGQGGVLAAGAVPDLGGSTYYTGGEGTTGDPYTFNMDVTPAPSTTASNGSTGGTPAGLGAGAEIGYTPPLWTGGPSTVGLAPGVAGQINTIAQNATQTFTSGVAGMFSGVENWIVRGGIIVVAVIVLLVALWRILDPSGSKTKAFAHAALA